MSREDHLEKAILTVEGVVDEILETGNSDHSCSCGEMCESFKCFREDLKKEGEKPSTGTKQPKIILVPQEYLDGALGDALA